MPYLTRIILCPLFSIDQRMRVFSYMPNISVACSKQPTHLRFSLTLTLLAAGANAAAPATREAMMAVFILIFDRVVGFDRLCLPWWFHKQAGGQVEPRTRRSFSFSWESLVWGRVDVRVGSLASFRGRTLFPYDLYIRWTLHMHDVLVPLRTVVPFSATPQEQGSTRSCCTT